MEFELGAMHPHAYVHGLVDDEIFHAWDHELAWIVRECEGEKDRLVLVGNDQHGRFIEIVAVEIEEAVYMAIHAMTPPAAKTLREVGLVIVKGGRS